MATSPKDMRRADLSASPLGSATVHARHVP